MRPTPKPALVLLAALVIAVPAAGSDVVRLFGPGGAHPGSNATFPKVLTHPEVDGFLVIGRDGEEAMTRRVGIGPDGEIWTLPARGLGVEVARGAAYNHDIGSYFVPTNRGSLRLDRYGRVRRRVEPDVSNYWSRNSEPLSIAGTRRWMVLTWACKFGCVINSGVFLGPGLNDRRYLIDFPAYWALDQIEWDPGQHDLLMLWTKPASGDKPQKFVTYGQHFRLDGALVGERFEVVRRRPTEYHPLVHMARNSRRDEWLIVFRRGRRINGRLLRGDELSPPFRISDRTTDPTAPSAAYNAKDDSYLVTWLAGGAQPELRGRWLTAEGRRTGKKLVIHDPEHVPFVYVTGYSGCDDSGRCLVLWNDDDFAGAIRGRFLSP